MDRYYREFIAQATPLTAASRMTDNEANPLLYRGILPSMQKKIRRKIPAAHQTSTAAPSIASVLTFLQAQFDEDDLDNDDDDVELAIDSDEDYELSDLEDEDYILKKPQRHKKIKLDTKMVPGTGLAPQIVLMLNDW